MYREDTIIRKIVSSNFEFVQSIIYLTRIKGNESCRFHIFNIEKICDKNIKTTEKVYLDDIANNISRKLLVSLNLKKIFRKFLET